MYIPTISLTKSGEASYVQQQQQASSYCHQFSESDALNDKKYPSARRVYCIIKPSERHTVSQVQRVWTSYA
jgi:hypothetical protein